MPWGYLVPTGLPAPEKADLPIIDEDLVATEAVTPPGGSTTNDDEGHVWIIGLQPREMRQSRLADQAL